MKDKNIPLEDWLRGEDAASSLGVTTKTLLDWARQGKLRTQKLPTGFRPRVYHPADIEHLKVDPNYRAALDVSAGASTLPAAPSRRPEYPALTNAGLTAMFQEVYTAALSRTETRHSLAELRHKVYLSEAEAVAYSGLGKEVLRSVSEGGNLRVLARSGPKQSLVYRRADLDKL